MIEGSEEFWQSCVVRKPYGSGGQSNKDGWIVAFNPINEIGQWVKIVEDHKILDLTNEFTFHVNDNGDSFDLITKAGPVDNLFNNGVLSIANEVKFSKFVKVAN